MLNGDSKKTFNKEKGFNAALLELWKSHNIIIRLKFPTTLMPD